ncbi:sugar porter family MFS transporter [Streptomyces sp. NPDC127039]|uniref:sugar porter family MFS transporter n=1 Tax=Streptomyces sp. NPDC127039 TaxID=3347115 RepID=UPI00365484D8
MSTTSRISLVRGPWPIYVIGAFAELLFGYDNGIIGVAMLSIKKEFPVSPLEEGFIVSSLLLGAAVGAGLSGRLSDRFGRRPLLVLVGVVFGAGGLVAAVAPSVPVLVTARVFMGLGVGSSAVVVSVYLIEIAPTRHRGKIGSLGQMLLVIGILLAYVIGYALQPSNDWRLMLGITALPSAAIVVALLLVPESPRWLVQRGRTADATAALTRLGRGTEAPGELAELQRSVATSRTQVRSTGALLKLMFSRPLTRASIAGIGLCVLIQFTGTNAIVYFAPSALKVAGFGDTAAVTANIGIGAFNVAFTVLGLFLVDRVRRRTLITAGSIGMTVAMAFLALHGLAVPAGSAAGGWATLAGMIVFLSCFAFSWGILVRVIVTELFPSSLRGGATGVIIIAQWLANFVVSQSFPTILDTSAVLGYSLFAVMGAIAILFSRTLLPETGGARSLEDLEAETLDTGTESGGTPVSTRV